MLYQNCWHNGTLSPDDSLNEPLLILAIPIKSFEFRYKKKKKNEAKKFRLDRGEPKVCDMSHN